MEPVQSPEIDSSSSSEESTPSYPPWSVYEEEWNRTVHLLMNIYVRSYNNVDFCYNNMALVRKTKQMVNYKSITFYGESSYSEVREALIEWHRNYGIHTILSNKFGCLFHNNEEFEILESQDHVQLFVRSLDSNTFTVNYNFDFQKITVFEDCGILNVCSVCDN